MNALATDRAILIRNQPAANDSLTVGTLAFRFFATLLELMLRYFNVQRVILTGIAGNSCILLTAADAYMHNFGVAVPGDCIVSIDPEANRSALNTCARL